MEFLRKHIVTSPDVKYCPVTMLVEEVELGVVLSKARAIYQVEQDSVT
jgi:hypothetical protein